MHAHTLVSLLDIGFCFNQFGLVVKKILQFEYKSISSHSRTLVWLCNWNWYCFSCSKIMKFCMSKDQWVLYTRIFESTDLEFCAKSYACLKSHNSNLFWNWNDWLKSCLWKITGTAVVRNFLWFLVHFFLCLSSLLGILNHLIRICNLGVIACLVIGVSFCLLLLVSFWLV